MKNLFEKAIADAIVTYPLLFCKKNYMLSELSFLDHIFFVIGNGYEWKNGYPLANSDTGKIKKYKNIDIAKFFDEKDEIKYLEIDESIFTGKNKAVEFAKKNNINFDDIALSEFSNKRILYTKDINFIKSWNDKIDAINKEKVALANAGKIEFDGLIDKFENLPDSEYVGIDNNDLSRYSKIVEMKDGNYINNEYIKVSFNDETKHNALKILNYVLYINRAMMIKMINEDKMKDIEDMKNRLENLNKMIEIKDFLTK